MELLDKLTILANGAKYDAACTSSGAQRPGNKGLGSVLAAGCCHSFSADGRCISLLKVLMTNYCIHDCKYCVNRRSNDVARTAFTPEELAELTIQFYRRNYIEGLFLSSGILRGPDFTMEMMIKALELIRHRHGFQGYIHAKAIPGAAPELVYRLGLLADRLSVNVEMPSEESLRVLAPDKTKQAIFRPMQQIAAGVAENRRELVSYKHAPQFANAGQATQMIIGASPETDRRILTLADHMYQRYGLKRVFYSAYIPVVEDSLLPAVDTQPPLLREHRLYQADFLLRQYHFAVDEILSESAPNFNPYLDPKCNWAVQNMAFFPVDINKAPLPALLRVPGIGPTSARRILVARKAGRLGTAELKKIGVVLKRAQYFILTADYPAGLGLSRETTVRALIDPGIYTLGREQLSLFGPAGPALADRSAQWPALAEGPAQGPSQAAAVTAAAATLAVAANTADPLAFGPGGGQAGEDQSGLGGYDWRSQKGGHKTCSDQAAKPARSGGKVLQLPDLAAAPTTREAAEEMILCLTQSL